MKIFLVVLLILMAGCKSEGDKKINKIKEASGISYCKDSNTLLVVGDEGDLYEILPSGKILSKHHLGDFDLEGVVCDGKRAILAEESGYLLVVDRESFKFNRLKIDGFKFNKKRGIEGIAKVGDDFVLAIQAKKRKKAKLLIVEIDKNGVKLKRVIDSGIVDSAGVEYRDGVLFVISDKKDKIYLFDLDKKRVIKKIKLPKSAKFAQEGITFDKNGDIYLANDDGGVFKFSPKELF